MKKKIIKNSSGKIPPFYPSLITKEIFYPIKNSSINSLLFTDRGQVYQIKGWYISEGVRIFNAESIRKLTNLNRDEKIASVLTIHNERNQFKYLYMCTKRGQVKKTQFKEYLKVRKTGQIAMLLDNSDTLGWVNPTMGNDDLIIISSMGQSIRFEEKDIKSTHRDTLGVRGIKLLHDDFVSASFLIKNDMPSKILVITEYGKGKMSPTSAWSRQLRGGMGIKAAQITKKTGQVISAQLINKEVNNIIISTNKNRTIIINIGKVPTLQRQTQGNRLTILNKEEEIVAAIAVSSDKIKSDTKTKEYFDSSKNSGTEYNPYLRYEELQDVFIPLQFSRNNSIEVLGLPIRIENALKQADIHRLGELCDYPEKKLYKIRNLGPKSVRYLFSIKNKLIFGSESSKGSQISATEFVPTAKMIDGLMKRCGDIRNIQVIQRRYGLLNGEKETLEEIGESLKITRERVRQIQKKAIKRMQHPSTLSRKPIIDLLNKLFIENDLIISDEESDKLVPHIFKKLPYDGSSLMDLFADLGWIQKHGVGDVSFYSTTALKIKLPELMEKIIQILRKSNSQLDLGEILSNIDLKQATLHQSIKNIVLKCCKSDPRIEDGVNGRFTLYKNNRIFSKWVPLITKVLEDEGEPLHFTEISERVNDLLISQNTRLEQPRAHSLLIENPAFAHTGIKGTYGLTKWGIRKESTFDLVKEYIIHAGFPVHWEQIYNYVSKYKYTSEATLRALLYSKFENAGNGLYTIKR